jgi:hypothetical protein
MYLKWQDRPNPPRREKKAQPETLNLRMTLATVSPKELSVKVNNAYDFLYESATERNVPSRRPQGRHLRSKIWWFTEFCNSHCLSHFAAFFIVDRAKSSIATSGLRIDLARKKDKDFTPSFPSLSIRQHLSSRVLKTRKSKKLSFKVVIEVFSPFSEEKGKKFGLVERQLKRFTQTLRV